MSSQSPNDYVKKIFNKTGLKVGENDPLVPLLMEIENNSQITEKKLNFVIDNQERMINCITIIVLLTSIAVSLTLFLMLVIIFKG